jgi:hypothetical protein
MTDDTQARKLADFRRWQAIGTIYTPNRPATILPAHQDLYEAAAAHIGADTPIRYLEFGVAHAKSMKAMAALFRHPDSRFHGYDSFVGLPEPWLMHDRGAFSTGGVLPNFGDSRVTFVPGWFQNTVPDHIAALPKTQAPVLIHYDADLYGSTLFLLSTVWHHVPDYFFLMDDFIHEDAVALHDFMRAYPVKVTFFAQTRGGGGNPDQVFGRITRTVFQPPD